jgi:hypothetical protein
MTKRRRSVIKSLLRLQTAALDEARLGQHTFPAPQTRQWRNGNQRALKTTIFIESQCNDQL